MHCDIWADDKVTIRGRTHMGAANEQFGVLSLEVKGRASACSLFFCDAAQARAAIAELEKIAAYLEAPHQQAAE